MFLGDYIDVAAAPAAAAAAGQEADGEQVAAAAADNASEEEEEDRNPSPRLVNLNLLLRDYLKNKRLQHEAAQAAEGGAAEPPKSRILVFVQTRSSVTVLKSYLNRHYPELKPNYAVGHGGQGGQSWGGGDSDLGQAAIIRDSVVDPDLHESASFGRIQILNFFEVRIRILGYKIGI
jgi:hypothetical protein